MNMEPDAAYEDHLRKARIAYLPDEFVTLFDIGCGSGRVPYGDRVVTGYEPDPELRALAAKTGKFKELLSSMKDFDLSQYDCVTLFGVLEHVEDVDAMLKQLVDAKNIFLTVPNARSIHRQVGLAAGMIDELTQLQEHDLKIGHKRYYTNHSLHKDLDKFAWENGFKIHAAGTLALKVLPSADHAKYLHLADSFDYVGWNLGLSGETRSFGADLYSLLRKK